MLASCVSTSNVLPPRLQPVLCQSLGLRKAAEPADCFIQTCLTLIEQNRCPIIPIPRNGLIQFNSELEPAITIQWLVQPCSTLAVCNSNAFLPLPNLMVGTIGLGGIWTLELQQIIPSSERFRKSHCPKFDLNGIGLC